MGWFSNEYVTTVGTSVSRVIQDNLLPNHLKTGLLRALLKNEDIPESVVGSMVTSVVLDVDRMYGYAQNHYVHGLPSGEFNSGSIPRGNFFPFAYFRYNKIPETANTSSASYLTTKKLVKYLGMDFDSVSASIDENPDIADVEQAMLMMGIPAYSQVPLEMRYLFEFFRNVWAAGAVNFVLPPMTLDERYAIQETEQLQVPNSLAIVIEDLRFKMALGNNGIRTELKTGNVAAPGEYACDVLPTTLQVVHLTPDSEGGYITSHRTANVMAHRYFHQTALNAYTEVRVVNMRMNYYVFEEYLSTADGLEEILLVPIDKSITDEYSITEKELIYTRSLHFVFNSRVVAKVKWYQTDSFNYFIMFVGAVIAIFTYGAAINAVAGAIIAGSGVAITTALLVVVEKILVGMITAYLLNLFVQAVGVKVALIVAIIALLAGAYMSIDAGSVSGAPWASELISLGNGLGKAVSADVQDMLRDLLNETNDFQQLMGTKYKELEEAEKLLQSHSWLSPMIFFGETPDDFYNRTVHSGNIGTISIGAISSYVDIALTLPKIDESVGGNHNEYAE